MSATSGTSPVSGVQWYSTPPIVSLVAALSALPTAASWVIEWVARVPVTNLERCLFALPLGLPWPT